MSLLVIGKKPKCPSCKTILQSRRHTGEVKHMICSCSENLGYYKCRKGIMYVFRSKDFRRTVVYMTVANAVAGDIEE